MEIKDNDYTISYDKEKSLIIFSGSLRLHNLKAYEPLKEMLKTASEEVDSLLTLNFKDLTFINSSGITTISMFIIDMRKTQKANIKVLGSQSVSWQKKSLANFQKLWSSVELEIE